MFDDIAKNLVPASKMLVSPQLYGLMLVMKTSCDDIERSKRLFRS